MAQEEGATEGRKKERKKGRKEGRKGEGKEGREHTSRRLFAVAFFGNRLLFLLQHFKFKSSTAYKL